jgi:hypothetical protein
MIIIPIYYNIPHQRFRQYIHYTTPSMRYLFFLCCFSPFVCVAGSFGAGLQAGVSSNRVQSYGAINRVFGYAFDLSYNTTRLYTGIRAESISFGNSAAYTMYASYKLNIRQQFQPYFGISAGYSGIRAGSGLRGLPPTGGTGFCGGIQGGIMTRANRHITLVGELGTRMGYMHIGNDGLQPANSVLPVITQHANTAYEQRRYSTIYLRVGCVIHIGSRKGKKEDRSTAPVEKEKK